MTNKIKIQKNQSIITEADKIITRLKIKHGIKKPLYLKQIPAIYYGILIKGGFKIYPHQFSKYGKVSISLRKTIDKQNIHISRR